MENERNTLSEQELEEVSGGLVQDAGAVRQFGDREERRATKELAEAPAAAFRTPKLIAWLPFVRTKNAPLRIRGAKKSKTDVLLDGGRAGGEKAKF